MIAYISEDLRKNVLLVPFLSYLWHYGGNHGSLFVVGSHLLKFQMVRKEPSRSSCDQGGVGLYFEGVSFYLSNHMQEIGRAHV